MPVLHFGLIEPQGFFNVTTCTRMTVVKLQDGGLWVHAPVAPTTECRRLLDELGEPVRYIVLPTTAVEHKIFVRPFQRAYPQAKTYVAPQQWSWPVNLPPSFRIDGILADNDSSTPWADEISQLLFQPPQVGIGPANEVVFFHKASATLICTDLVVWIDGNLPTPVAEVPELLKASLDDPETGETPPDSLVARRRGWARMALQILFLGPAKYSTFKLINRRLLVSPVIQTFVLSKIPVAAVDFIDRLTSSWAFRQVIPCHFNAPAKATPADLQQAFAFAYVAAKRTPAEPARLARHSSSESSISWLGSLLNSFSLAGPATARMTMRPIVFPESDTAVLRAVNDFLLKVGVASR